MYIKIYTNIFNNIFRLYNSSPRSFKNNFDTPANVSCMKLSESLFALAFFRIYLHASKYVYNSC